MPHTVTVRLLTGLVGPFVAYEPGDLYDCPSDVADRLVQAGIAERLTDTDAPETAMVTAPERAIQPRARARKGAA